MGATTSSGGSARVPASCPFRPPRLRTTRSSGTHEGLSPSRGSALALRARRSRPRGRSPSNSRPSRQPKWVPPLPVVVSRAYRQCLRSGAPRLRTTRSSGTHQGLTTPMVQRSRSALAEGVLEGKARAGCAPSRQPKWVPPLPVVVPRPYRQRLRSGQPDSALRVVVAPIKDRRPRRFSARAARSAARPGFNSAARGSTRS